jgi:hypothetical protein
MNTGEVYSHSKEEALDRIKWRNRFGRGFGPVVWQIIDDNDLWTIKNKVEIKHYRELK